ncbi:response regulator transcription factor [Nocardioides sp.]|uniref:response regulator transcription factor n=1 Tax=Nocardioides sp. TaxID=35761 RepID=UPI00286D75E2|nr:response regulator transcription factor [Nocardioides sp.]
MKHVLMGEDDRDVATLLGILLGGAGFSVDLVGTGPEVIEAYAARVPDVVLLDVSMPGMDGLEVTRQLRSRFGEQVPVMLLTARASEEDRANGLLAGADDYVVKPFDVDDVLARLTRLLTRSPG